MSSASTVDLTLLENEINERFSNNPDYDIDNLQLYAELTPYSYVPIPTTFDANNKIHVEPDPNLIGVPVFIGSKHQFIHKQIKIEYDTYCIELDSDFNTAWDKSRFLIFQNGYLMNNGLFIFIIPNYNNSYLKKKIYTTAVFKTNAIIDIFYIENDDFFNLPISRDVYLKGVKYIATINDDTVIPIPYPNPNIIMSEESFFVFNEQGRILDSRSDYVISHDGKYITLIGDNKLKHLNINYIIFAFAQLPLSSDYDEELVFDDDNNEIESNENLSGNPIFKYAFSVDDYRSELDRSGVIRFSPEFEDYTLTKSNFLLFGNGIWIDPSRYDVYGNDAVIFNNDEDMEKLHLTKFTMVILNDTTDHTEFQIPMKYQLLQLTASKDNQYEFYFPQVDSIYKSFLIFKGSILVPSEYYEYDSVANGVTFTHEVDAVSDERTVSALFVASIVNNTNQEGMINQIVFDCNPKPYEGTQLPRSMLYQDWDPAYLMLFLNGRYLRHEEYDIIDKRIYLDDNFFANVTGDLYPLEGHKFTAVYLGGVYKADQEKLPDEKVENIMKKTADFIEDAKGGAMFFHGLSDTTESNISDATVVFNPKFNEYVLTKPHVIIFKDGKLMNSDRYKIVNPYTVKLLNDDDIADINNVEFSYLVLTDSAQDERYNPTSYYTKVIQATEENQSIFELPMVHFRYQTFIMFDKEGNFIKKTDTYRVVNNTLEFFNMTFQPDDTITLIYLDSFARKNQETKFTQFSFPCNVSGTTKLPTNLYYDNFDTNLMMLFLNDMYVAPTHYTISGDELYLDYTIVLDPMEKYTYTVVWIANLLSSIKTYPEKLPKRPAHPYIPFGAGESPRFEFSYSSIVNDPRTSSGVLKFDPKFEDFTISKSNTLMFGDGKWINPAGYEIYSNQTTFITKYDERTNLTRNYTLAVFSDKSDQYPLYAPSSFKIREVEAQSANQREFTIPSISYEFQTFLAFHNGVYMPTGDDTKYIVTDRKLTIIDPEYYIPRHDKVVFVFLNAITVLGRLTLFSTETFDYAGEPIYSPLAATNMTFDKRVVLVFMDNVFIEPRHYEMTENIITFDETVSGSKLTLVHLLQYFNDEDVELDLLRKPEGEEDGFVLEYSYSVDKPFEDRSDLGLITFSPKFDDYRLKKDNFLLFTRGTWVSPTRFELLTNNTIQFFDDEDKDSADWGHYTMAILTEAIPKEPDYKPVSFTVRSVTAVADNQQIFDIPYVGEKASFLVFKGSLLLPLTNEERILVNEETNRLVLLDPEDAVEKGRDLLFVFLSDSSTNDKRKPIFIQETIMAAPDPTVGTLIPSSWYTKENFDDRFVMLFFGGMYLSPAMYDIIDKRIYLKDTYYDLLLGPDAFSIKKKYYTCVFISSYTEEGIIKEDVLGEYEYEVEEEEEERVVPEDDKLDPDAEGLVFETYVSDDLAVADRDNNDFIQFRDAFEAYPLEKENFLLFDNTIWVDPDRYEVLSNYNIIYHQDEDKTAANWSHTSMIVINNQKAVDFYGGSYIRPKFKMVRVLITEMDKFEYPAMPDEYQSFLAFYNSRILPIFDDERFYIDEYTHNASILNIEDYMEVGKYITLLFLNSKTNTGEDIVLVQDTFKCTGDVTIIPKSLYTYENQTFYKKRTLLFINNLYVDPAKYRIHDNKIYMVEPMPLTNPYSFTMVYLTNHDFDDGEDEAVVDETYEHPIDDIIFERAYVKPYIPVPITDKKVKTNNDLIFNFCHGTRSGIQMVQFEPAFSKYKLFKNNVLILADGKYFDAAYSLITNDTITFPSLEAGVIEHYNNFSMIIMADSGSYGTGFTPSTLITQTQICNDYVKNTFDIMVQDDWEEPRSFMVFGKDRKLLDNYNIDWKRKQITFNDNEDNLDPEQSITFVYLDCKYNKHSKYNVLVQKTVKGNPTLTRLPEPLKSIGSAKIMVFKNREYLPNTEYNIYGGSIYSGSISSNDKITVIGIVESDNPYRESNDRIIKR